MGNCVFRPFGDIDEAIKVITSDGGIMEFTAPIAVESITNEFPGHGIYKTPRSHQFLSQLPLLHNEELLAGEMYYLLPLNTGSSSSSNVGINTTTSTSTSSAFVTPYRMSFDFNHHHGYNNILKRSESEVIRSSSSSSSSGGGCGFSNYRSSGIWKVKLVISPEQLSEILSQENSTEALVQSMRTVAKCGGNGVISSSSNTTSKCNSVLSSSDQWSLSSSRKGSSIENFS